MAFTVGTDTYISVADAATYINSYCISSAAKVVTWNGLNNEDKEVYLRQAAVLIDRQPLVGFKSTSSQTLAFPRSLYSDYGNSFYGDLLVWTTPGWYTQTSVPDDVKYAQVEIALSLAQGISERQLMVREGVKSYSIGHLSETLQGKSRLSRIPSEEALNLLRKYLAGTVPIK
jgi:hypothetical protein